VDYRVVSCREKGLLVDMTQRLYHKYHKLSKNVKEIENETMMFDDR